MRKWLYFLDILSKSLSLILYFFIPPIILLPYSKKTTRYRAHTPEITRIWPFIPFLYLYYSFILYSFFFYPQVYSTPILKRQRVFCVWPTYTRWKPIYLVLPRKITYWPHKPGYCPVLAWYSFVLAPYFKGRLPRKTWVGPIYLLLCIGPLCPNSLMANQ